MVIDFGAYEETINHEFKGGKGDTLLKKHEDELGKILYGRLEPGSSIGFHKHETDSEIIYILRGKANIFYDDTTEELGPGGCHYCPMGHSHSMANQGVEDLIFFAVVPQHRVDI
ncbi:MAG: cupin domain-containing protein [Lachnospiraceae bacterium]|nr:cupin domain-containing protein [Lachnospiraceae bacterium]